MKVLLEGVRVHQGLKKETNQPYYYVEVEEPVRKFISGLNKQDEGYLADLATSGEFVDLELSLQNNRLYIKNPN